MSWNTRIRQLHRWLSIVFTVAVIVTTIVLTQGKPPAWASYLPLPPLFLLLFTGLYLFVLPYVTRRQTSRPIDTRGGDAMNPPVPRDPTVASRNQPKGTGK